MATIDFFLDPERGWEVACRSCGMHQGECDGPPARCCEACEHWDPAPLSSDADYDEDDVLAGQLLISVTVDDYLASRGAA